MRSSLILRFSGGAPKSDSDGTGDSSRSPESLMWATRATLLSGLSSADFLSSFLVSAGLPLVKGFSFFCGSSAGASVTARIAAADNNQRDIRDSFGGEGYGRIIPGRAGGGFDPSVALYLDCLEWYSSPAREVRGGRARP